MTNFPKTPSFRLEGKRALVTGASSGIGLACAVSLAEAGADVVLAARNLSKLQTVTGQFVQQGWKAEPLMLDISDIEGTQKILAEQPIMDIVVNSAGTARHSPAADTTLEDYDAVMDVNTRGAYFLAQTAAKRMIAEKRRGSIIFISSQMARVGGIDRAVYCGSKHALEGFQKAMAFDWGPYGIRVNSICPTFIRTPLTEGTFKDADKLSWIQEKIKLGRVGEVEDIMGATVFLASDAAAMITGTSILVDGGWTAG